ncbi:uncharacterized protein O3C94_017071 isoform 1-T1 [Discoglossus pictus]
MDPSSPKATWIHQLLTHWCSNNTLRSWTRVMVLSPFSTSQGPTVWYVLLTGKPKRQDSLSLLQHQAAEGHKEPTHPFQPGDLVCVRQLNRAKKGGFPFGPPTTDVAVTRTAVLTDSQDIWIHASRLKLCPKRGEAGDKVPVKAIEDSDNKNVRPTLASTECMEELSPVDVHYAPDLFALMNIS